MKKNRITKTGDAEEHVKLLIFYRTPFTKRETNNTTVIITHLETRVYTEKKLPLKDLSFIGRVKKYAKALSPTTHPEQPYKSRDVNYWRFKNIAQTEYHDLTEIDVNSAYWELALRFGYISQELYSEAEQYDKMTRLVALGALATKYQHWQYDGGDDPPRYITVEPTDDEKRIRSYFFHVAAHLGKIMQAVANTYDGVLWYWVDAFFVTESDAKRIPEALAAHGLKCKEVKIKKVTVEELFWDDGTRRGKALCVYEAGGMGYKPFFLEDKKQKIQRRSEAIRLALNAPARPAPKIR
jgi:hypothetical protein